MNNLGNFNENNISKIKRYKELMDKGSYADANEIVDTYNEVFEGIKVKQNYTHCGSCIRRCISELHNAYTKYQEEKLKALEAIDKFMTEDEEEVKKVKKTKKNK